MSNAIFDWPASLRRFVRFTTARAEDVNDALDELSAGLDVVEQSIDRSIKVPTGSGDQTIQMPPGLRAGLTLGFDANGDITAYAAGGRWAGDWATGTGYAPGDVYRDPTTKNLYSVVSAHTSTTVAADLAAGKVSLAVDVSEIESNRTLAQAAADTATDAAISASSFTGFKGDWSSLSGPLQMPASVTHRGQVWVLLEPIADVTAEQPGVSSKWRAYDVVMPIVKTGGPPPPGGGVWNVNATPHTHVVVDSFLAEMHIHLPDPAQEGDYIVVTTHQTAAQTVILDPGAGSVQFVAEPVTLDLPPGTTYSLRYIGTTWRFI